MSYSITEVNGIKIYNLSAGKSLPQFVEEAYKKNKSLRYYQEYRNRLEVIHDFEFPATCTQVTLTEDQQYIIATGVYGPRVKIFDTQELSLKCERGLTAEVIKFKVLTPDYSKLVFACTDRTLQFHAQYGQHYQTRTPRPALNLEFNHNTSDLMIPSFGNVIYRLSLDLGQYLQPFKLNLLMSGGDQGVCEFWDYRVREKIMKWQCGNEGITEMQNCENGVVFATGGEKGGIKLYDIRYQKPLLSYNHHYKLPINTIKFHEKTRMLLSSSKKMIKINNFDSGKLFTNIEPKTEINRFELCQDSGMLLTASEEPRIGIFFIPQLDNAPRWCPFLENVTEELEEKDITTVYDEFKFLSYDDLEALNCSNLMGTKLLKSHLHGFLMHNKLYEKIKNKSDRFVLEDYKQAKVQEKMQEQTNTRIKKKQVDKTIRFNKEFVEEIQTKNKNNKHFNVDSFLQDDRFVKMFTSKDYVIDKNSENYQLQHPSEKNGRVQRKIEDDEEIDAEIGEKIQDMDQVEEILSQKTKKIKKLVQEKKQMKNQTFEKKIKKTK